jgi:hypothetical protein
VARVVLLTHGETASSNVGLDTSDASNATVQAVNVVGLATRQAGMDKKTSEDATNKNKHTNQTSCGCECGGRVVFATIFGTPA